ncbi:hypothetical protein CR513_34828, partial [Mucuna pruriens]
MGIVEINWIGTSRPIQESLSAGVVIEFRLDSKYIPLHSYAHSSSSRWCTILQWRFSQLRKHRSWTKRPKVVKGNCLACHHTLVDLILNALANRGKPSPFDHEMSLSQPSILKEQSGPNAVAQSSQPNLGALISAKSSSAAMSLFEEACSARLTIRRSETKSSPTPSCLSKTKSSPTILRLSQCLAETMSDPSLPTPSRISHYREQVDIPYLKSIFDPLSDLDPEIVITLRRLRKARNIVVSNSNSYNFVSSFNNSSLITNNSDSFEYSSVNNSVEPKQMENTDSTLKELETLNVKSDLIHLLPKFHGLAGEDPHKHLNELHVICSTMRLQGILEDYIKMKAFPFFLDGVTKD